MSRRIWVAEGFASDGDVYGRALQIPGAGAPGQRPGPGGTGGEVQRAPRASVLKTHLGDVPSCPCIASMLPQDGAAAGHDPSQPVHPAREAVDA
ncbi:hypothetical protein M5C99_00790 [Acidovorax sp. NCPPB 2350]|nr:hypothetical protein M5C99_00790 [Acidovorax sp. NCPPB 2350]